MSISNFIDNLESIYLNISIYRSVIVAKDDNEAIKFKKKLLLLNHNVLYIDSNFNNFNSEDIDNSYYRLFIITFDNFYSFINKIDIFSYNFIGISYTISEDDVNIIIDKYLKISNNNINNTYIFKNNNNINKIL